MGGSVRKFLTDLSCPKELTSQEDQLKWICNYAVKLEYMDNLNEYKSVTSEAAVMKSSAPSLKSVNPFDNLDCKLHHAMNSLNEFTQVKLLFFQSTALNSSRVYELSQNVFSFHTIPTISLCSMPSAKFSRIISTKKL